MLSGLAPIAFDGARLLILGSMPGAVSLKNGRYYDHKYNRFWPIMFKFAARDFQADYRAKLDLLKEKGIALWDVIGGCERENSSLDSKIKNAVPNDIAGFLSARPGIKHVIADGRTAEKFLVKYNPGIPYRYLPSTSPANASVKNVTEIWLSALHEMLD